MGIKLTLMLCLLANYISYAQINSSLDSVRKVAWLKQNAIPVKSIDPGEENFSDLMPLKSMIGNAQVLMLGEPNHHVGTIYLAKTRLIKFLHKEMGFDMLAYECDMYDVAKAWQDIKEGKDARQAFKNAIFFGGREEYKPLIEYLKQASRSASPLELTGFDLQMNGSYSRDSLFMDLREFFNGINYISPTLNDSSFFARELLKATGRNGRKTPDRSVIDTLNKLIKIVDSLAPRPLRFQAAFYHQVLSSIRKEVQRNLVYNLTQVLSNSDKGRFGLLQFSMRDEQMAENLLWYTKQYPTRKVIVIAHNDHLIMDYPGDKTKIRWDFGANAPPAPKIDWDNSYMGYVLKDSLKEKVFNIAITGNEGELGWIHHLDSSKTFKISIEKNVKSGTLENYLDAAGYHLAFVNLRNPNKGGEWLKKRFRSRYYGGPGADAEWHKAADAIFYIRKFTPTNIRD